MPFSMLVSASTCKKGRLTHDTITGVSKHEPMLTRREETRMCVTAITTILILLLLSLLCGCKARKVVTEYIVTHDTLVVGHTDTLRIVSHTQKTDTVREATVQYITIRQDSDRVDTIRVETYKDHYHTVYVHDSIDTYKAIADSLRKVIDSKGEKKVEVTKMKVPMKLAAFILVTVLAIIVLVTRDKSN